MSAYQQEVLLWSLTCKTEEKAFFFQDMSLILERIIEIYRERAVSCYIIKINPCLKLVLYYKTHSMLFFFQ